MTSRAAGGPEPPAAGGRGSAGATGGARRPATPRRYLIRRLGVLAVFALVGVGIWQVVATITRDDRSAVGSTPVDTSGVTSTIAGEPAGSGDPATAGTGVAAGATTTTVAPETPAVPTAESPAKVLIVGDSEAGVFAPYLERMLDGDRSDIGDIVTVSTAYKASSGLARPDFYDWPTHLAALLAEHDPDIVIANWGGNDGQGLSAPCPNRDESCDISWVVGSPEQNAEEWTAEYAKRVNEVLDLMNGREVIWVGIPNHQDPATTARLELQDAAVRQALAAHPTVRFVDTWRIFDGINGGYAELTVDPRDGVPKVMRRDDGFHLNDTGAEVMAYYVAEELGDTLESMGAQL